MRKLTLELDELRVQSFEVMPAAGTRRGTIHGRESETYDEVACAGATNASCDTGESCDTCDPCTQTFCDPTDTADPGRRIILY
jgi:hypothetical protein